MRARHQRQLGHRREVAGGLAKAGADVAINYVTNPDAAQAVVDEIRTVGLCSIAVHADASQEADVQWVFSAVFTEFGTLHIVICNAGLRRDSAFDQMTLAQWNTVIGGNLTGQFLCARSAVGEFKRLGMTQVSAALGKILCISWVHRQISWGGHANYAASKGGVMLLMQTMEQELAPLRIRVNSIATGAIHTPINTAAWNTPAACDQLMTIVPYGRIGEPSDIARAAV